MSPDIEKTLTDVLADGVFLCVRLGPGDPVLDACRAAIRGGLRVLEITLTTPGALQCIETLSREGDAIVGAGTVLRVEDVEAVANAGGRFVLSPVFDSDVVAAAHRLRLLAMPGTSTPTEILTAHRGGARLIKVFPAGTLGGPDFIRAVRGPLPDVPLVPTNGVTSDMIADYLDAGAVGVGIGAEVFPKQFTAASVENAARRVRLAMDSARQGR